MNERPFPQFTVCAFDIVTFALLQNTFFNIFVFFVGCYGTEHVILSIRWRCFGRTWFLMFFFIRSVSEWYSPGRKKHRVIQGSTLVPPKNRHDSSMDCNTVLRKFWCRSCCCRVVVVLGGFVSRWATHGFPSLTALVVPWVLAGTHQRDAPSRQDDGVIRAPTLCGWCHHGRHVVSESQHVLPFNTLSQAKKNLVKTTQTRHEDRDLETGLQCT